MATETPVVPLSPDDYLDHLLADLAAISAIPHSGLDEPVAAVGDWTVTDLVVHLAGVLDAAAARVTTPPGAERPSRIGRGDAAALDYFSDAAGRFVEALEATDPDAPRLNWWGEDRAFFYWRRLTHEALVHRWDIESAIGEPAPVDALMAIDGLDELCTVMLPHVASRGALPTDGTTVHFHVTDDGVGDTLPAGEWMLTFGADGLTVAAEHGKGDMAFRGRAANLVLFAWNRSTAGVAAFGDGDPLAWWADNVTI